MKNFVQFQSAQTLPDAALAAIAATGFLRGGRAGPTFFTDTYYKDAAVAYNKLALPVMPTHGIIFRITNRPPIHGPQRVDPVPERSQPGGGTEYWSEQKVQVQVLNVWELQ